MHLTTMDYFIEETNELFDLEIGREGEGEEYGRKKREEEKSATDGIDEYPHTFIGTDRGLKESVREEYDNEEGRGEKTR